MTDDLQPLAPDEALDLYLEGRRDELAEWTLTSHEYRLRAFVEWCETVGDIADLTELSGRDLYQFRVWRRSGEYAAEEDEDPEEIAPATLKTQLTTLRAFLRFAAEIDAVPEDLYEKVRLPSLSEGEEVSDTYFDPERADPILDYLHRYHYASRMHVVFALLWETGARQGAIRALDLRDLDLDGGEPSIRYRHRPESETPLKNDEDGERVNSISDRMAEILRDFIDGPRPDTVDDYGRSPLLATTQGRACASTIRGDLYKVTRPCWRGEECPHGREIEECEATDSDHHSECPSSRPPHDVRKGVVTDYRGKDVPRQVVSDELDASEQILEKHYDRRGERQRARQRRRHLPDR